MSKIILWKVYYMSTNAKTDVWTQNDFLKRKILEKNQINKPKNRLTIPIQKLRILNSREEIYLVCQINTNIISRSLNLPPSLHQKNSLIHGGILPINIRMASANEAKEFKENLFVDKHERNEFYKTVWQRLSKDSWLKWRLRKIKEMINGKYDDYDSEKVIELLRYTQFNYVELKHKGNINPKKELVKIK